MQDTDSNWYSEEASTFGDRLVGAREQMGWTQQELAKRLGVKLKTVRSWEEDLNEPRANKLQMLAGILNVSIMWLISGEGDGVDTPYEDRPLPGNIAEILTEMRQVRAQMDGLVDQLAVLEKRLRTTLKEQV